MAQEQSSSVRQYSSRYVGVVPGGNAERLFLFLYSRSRLLLYFPEIQMVDDEEGEDQKAESFETTPSGEDDRLTSDELDADDPARDDEPQDNASTRSSEPYEATASAATCVRTGLIFPSSVGMKLLPVYDDGLSPTVTSAPLPSEPVFCRICREGLHDDRRVGLGPGD